MGNRLGTSICLFGAYPVHVGGRPCRLGISGSTERLFQFLLVNSGKVSRREFLAELFWRGSSPDRQRSALNSAIWRIKRKIRDIDGLELHCDGAVVYLHIDHRVRVDAFELADVVRSIPADQPMSDEMAERLYRALDACDASFMDGVTSSWVLTEREQFFNIKNRGLALLMHWLGQKRRYEEALEIGRRLLAADPARESAQCEVMWLYVLNGQRAQAIRQFQEFRAWLKAELDIEPMPETLVLYDHIRLGLDSARSKPTRSASTVNTSQSRRSSFNSLLGAIEQSRRDLYEALSSQLP